MGSSEKLKFAGKGFCVYKDILSDMSVAEMNLRNRTINAENTSSSLLELLQTRCITHAKHPSVKGCFSLVVNQVNKISSLNNLHRYSVNRKNVFQQCCGDL